MSSVDEAVERFLRDVDKVYGEYENGYMDADAALSVLEDHIESLRAQVE